MICFIRRHTSFTCMGFFLMISLLTKGISFGQSSKPYYFEHYAQEKGLSQGSGYTSVQFDDFVWLGTQDGLNRFDGYGFKIYKNLPVSNFVAALLDDLHGHLWVGSSRGLAIYDPKTDLFITFEKFIGHEHPLQTASVRQLLRDKSGNIWVLTDKDGAFHYNFKNKTTQSFPDFSNKLIDISEGANGSIFVATDEDVFRLDADKKSFSALRIKSILGLNENAIIRAILSDHLNQLWVGTYENGLFTLQQNGKILNVSRHIVKGNSPQNISSNEITRLMEDSKNQIWIGTRTGGISVYNPDNQHFKQALHAENKINSLAENFVLSFSEDRQKNVWVGLSGGGFDKYDPRKYQFNLIRKNEPNLAESLSDNMVFKIFQHQHYLYIGTQSGGITTYDPNKREFKTYKNIPGNPTSLLHNEVYDISADDAGKLWVATGKGLCRFDTKTQRFESFTEKEEPGLVYLFAAQAIRGQNEVWTGGQRGLHRFDTKENKWKTWDDLPQIKAISKYVIRLIFEDSETNIWIGTIGHGLFKYSKKTKIVSHLDQKKGIDCANIRSVFEDEKSFWIGTDCGAFVLNKKNGVSSHFTESNGLPNNVVYAILKDRSGSYWLSTNNGITHYNPIKKSFKTYTASDGLQSNEFNTNCALADSAGLLYFGGVKGISYFNPADIVTNSFVPPVKITAIEVMDEVFKDSIATPYLKSIKLPYDQNFISIEFSAFNLSNSEKNTYQYKLEGIQENWVKAGYQHVAKYTNLPPGNYVFSVRGANDDGIENPLETNLEIHINPPYWQTWWFRSLISLAIAGVIYIAFRNRAARIREEERQKAEIQRIRSEAEMLSLRAQISPQIIYNSLNSVDAYILINKRKDASNFLQIFSRMMRKMLENSKYELISIEDDLETLRLFTRLEEERYGNLFVTEFDVDPALIENRNQIPPLLLQSFIENAIEHGLRNPKSEKGFLMISLKADKKKLLVEISDNGNGFRFNDGKTGFHKSMGMDETVKRIASFGDLHNMKTAVTISETELETKVRFVLPLLF